MLLLLTHRYTLKVVSGLFCTTTSSCSSSGPLRVLFFGTDEFSLPTLKALHADMNSSGSQAVSRLEVCCIRMKHLVSSVQKYSDEHGLPAHSWPPQIAFGQFDIGVVASFGKLLPKRIIESFPRGVLNVHASLLPRWRGASPIVHAIMHGDKQTGISIMEVKPHHFDIGGVLAQKSCPIAYDISRKALSEELAILGADLMMEVLSNLDHFFEQREPQNSRDVTYAPVIDNNMFHLRWDDMSADDVWNRYRALSDFGKLHSTWQDTGEEVRFDQMVKPDELTTLEVDKLSKDTIPGEAVYLKRCRLLCIKCRDGGWVSFRQFYYGKRKVMNSLDFYNGLVSKHKGTKTLCFV